MNVNSTVLISRGTGFSTSPNMPAPKFLKTCQMNIRSIRPSAVTVNTCDVLLTTGKYISISLKSQINRPWIFFMKYVITRSDPYVMIRQIVSSIK